MTSRSEYFKPNMHYRSVAFLILICWVIIADFGRLSAQSIQEAQDMSFITDGSVKLAPEQREYLKNHDSDHVNSSFNSFWLGTADLLQRWNTSSRDTGKQGGFRAGVSGGAASGLYGLNRTTLESFKVDPRYMHLNLGPILLDQFIVGAGVIGVDESGSTLPGNSNANDGWAGLVWASMRASFMLSESFIVSLQPSVYWSFSNNKIGWMFNPFAANLRPNVLGELSYDFQINNWQFNLYDRLGATLAAGRWAQFPSRQSSASSIADQVGRYGFNMYGEADSWDIAERFTLNNWQQFMRFYNFAGITGQTKLTDTMSFKAYMQKVDMWDYDFNLVRARIETGAYVSIEGQYIQPFASYIATSRDPYDFYFHQLYGGAKFTLRENLTGSASVGYLKTSGSGPKVRDTWLGLASLNWQMTSFTSHSLWGGRRVLNTAYLPLSLDDFVEYRLSQQIGFGAEFNFTIGTLQRQILENSRGLTDGHLNYAGGSLQFLLNEKLRLALVSGYENASNGTRDFQRWTHRVNLDSMLSETLSMQLFYQYLESSGSIDFNEHALFSSISKRF